jgi:hypothetical protein
MLLWNSRHVPVVFTTNSGTDEPGNTHSIFIVVGRPCFEEQNVDRWIFRETVGDDQASWSAADDDVVVALE